MIIDVIGKIEATETHARLTGARSWPAARTARRNVVGVETVLIVDLALLGIAQDVVSFLDFLEALLGGFIAGVQIRMILARQLAVRLADLVFFGRARYTERLVIILFACGWHRTGSLSPATASSRSRLSKLRLSRLRIAKAEPANKLLLTSCRRRPRTRRRPHCLWAWIRRRPLRCRRRPARLAAARRPAGWKLCTWPRPVCGWPSPASKWPG